MLGSLVSLPQNRIQVSRKKADQDDDGDGLSCKMLLSGCLFRIAAVLLVTYKHTLKIL